MRYFIVEKRHVIVNSMILISWLYWNWLINNPINRLNNVLNKSKKYYTFLYHRKTLKLIYNRFDALWTNYHNIVHDVKY